MLYGADERQRFRVWATGTHWLVIIHGGAWRDERITQESGTALANALLDVPSGIASVDYRLSPGVKHPVHVNDVEMALNHLMNEFKARTFTLLGHSAGAFIAGQLLDRDLPITNIICLEGIYDLYELADEYPAYEEFITQAFGAREHWAAATPSWSSPVSALLVWSSEDELLSERQVKLCQAKMKHSELLTGPLGKHDEVFEAPQQSMIDVIWKHCHNPRGLFTDI